MVTKITTRQKVHHQVQIISVLKGIVHVNDEGVVELGEDLAFIHNRLDTAFCEYACLGHLLHRVKLFALFLLNLPHFSKTTFTNAVLVREVIFSEC